MTLQMKYSFKLWTSKSKIVCDRDWFSFSNKWSYTNLTFSFTSCYDPRPLLVIDVTTVLIFLSIPFLGLWSMVFWPFLIISWGRMYIRFPFITYMNKKIVSEVEPPEYGFYLTDREGGDFYIFDTLVIELGKRSKVVSFFWTFEWYRTLYLLSNGEWVDRKESNDADLKKWEYFYTYVTQSKEVQTALATITVFETEWRRRGWKTSSWLNKTQRFIQVKFSEEIGEDRGSWKGGVTGCSYPLPPNTHPLEAIKNMEKNRKF
jgi:hypothetical protein